MSKPYEIVAMHPRVLHTGGLVVRFTVHMFSGLDVDFTLHNLRAMPPYDGGQVAPWTLTHRTYHLDPHGDRRRIAAMWLRNDPDLVHTILAAAEDELSAVR